jgi:hypothetical protein
MDVGFLVETDTFIIAIGTFTRNFREKPAHLGILAFFGTFAHDHRLL